MLLAANRCNWRRPGLPLFGTSFLRVLPSTKSERALCLFFQFLMKKMLLPQPPIMLPLHKGLHTWWQQGGLPEEGDDRRTSSRFSYCIKVCYRYTTFWVPGAQERCIRRPNLGAQHAKNRQRMPMVMYDPGTRRSRAHLRAGTDVTERRANPSQPALGARMTFVAHPHTPSNKNVYIHY